MACKKVLLSNSCDKNWVYFNFRRCSDSYFENQYGVPPLEHREVHYIDGTLITAFESCVQIDPNGYNITGLTTTTTTAAPPTTTTTTIPPTTTTTTLNYSAYTLKYSTVSMNDACSAGTVSTFYIQSSNNSIYQSILFSDSSLTTVAPNGYYLATTLPCPDIFNHQAYEITAQPGYVNSAYNYNPCSNYTTILTRYLDTFYSVSGLCASITFKNLTTEGTSTPSIGNVYYTTSPCMLAPDGYYSQCNCATGVDYFVISGGTGQVSDVIIC